MSNEDLPWVSLRKAGAAAVKRGNTEEAAAFFKAAADVERQYANAEAAKDRQRNSNYLSDFERGRGRER